MADAIVSTADGRVKVVPFGAEALAPLVTSASAAAAAAAAAADLTAGATISVGDLPQSSIDKATTNGATTTATGISIPNGSTGAGSYILQLVAIAPDLAQELAGSTVRIISVTPTSAGLLSHHNLSTLAARSIVDGSTIVDGGTIISTEDIGGAIRRVVEFEMSGDETEIGNIIQISGSYTIGARTLDVGTTSIAIASRADPASASSNDYNLDWRLNLARKATLSEVVTGIDEQVKLISATGGGDATSPGGIAQGDLAAIPAAPWQLLHNVGTYGLVGLPTFDDVNLKSRMGRDQVTYRAALANNTAIAMIAASSTVDATTRSVIDGLTIDIANGRYALHSEANGANPGKTLVVSNCRLTHFGNAGAVAYQTSLGGSGNPSGVWQITVAMGVGTASGNTYRQINNIFVGPIGGYLSHNNPAPNPAYGAVIEHVGGASAASSVNYPSHNYQSLGTGRMERVLLVGQSFTGSIQHLTNAGTWTPSTGVGHPADHREHEICGYGNVPEVYWSKDYGLALRITSPTSSGTSSVQMSGSAITALTAASRPVKQVPGGAGLAAYAYASADVSGVVSGKSLGGLLGDCTSVAKVLTLSINGGSAVNYSLTANYTAMSNSAVLSAINTLLGGAATADLFSPGSEYYPHIWDEERILINASGADIERGWVVAMDGDDRKVRAMTNADPAWRFAGVALERICSGQVGRVKHKGKMALPYIARSDSGTPAFGAAMGIGASAGKIAVTHSGADLFRVIRAAGGNDDNDAVQFLTAGA